jgi:hypothetical protein
MSRLFPSSRGSSTCPWYTVGGNTTDKNLEQRKNIRFCVKIGKSASETLALLTVAYGKFALKNLFLNGIGDSKKSEKMCKTT